MQMQLFTGAPENNCSEELLKIHKKTSAIGSFFTWNYIKVYWIQHAFEVERDFL